MSDNEYERFEISDYDLANEFNINRPRRRQTKHQQIYGIWADDSENDSEEESGKRGRGRRGRGGKVAGGKPKDYTAPVSFVAGGIQQSGKKNKRQDDDNADDGDKGGEITDEEEDERPSFGRKQPQLMEQSSGSSDSSEEQPKKAPPPKRGGFGAQNKSHSMGSDRNVGAWEQHTRGIGAKLLLQMGYKPGKGLGKDLQGIAQPVEAHVRKGRGAIGAYGPETAASVGGKGHQPKEDEDEREAKEFKEKLNKWKKGGDARPDKSKRYYYKSVEEVIEKGKKSNFMLPEKISHKLGNVPVIDMTGPEKRVLSGYHALAQNKVVDEDLYDLQATTATKQSVSFALPELMHNLNLIVDLCERDIIDLDKAERAASDRQHSLEQERKNLEEIVNLESNHIHTLEKVEALVDELTSAESNLTLDRAEKIFLELQTEYPAEFQEFGLADLAAGIIAPLVKATLDEWQPLLEPTHHIDLVKKWRCILEKASGDQQSETRNVFDPYSSVIWAGVIPSFRTCSAAWNPKQHQKMAALLDSWAPLFPSWILDSVLEQLVLPRLVSGVQEWDPLTDTVPIHIWILPWTTILGHKMEESIFPTIRVKLGNALQAWMPQDRSARAMLTPWKGAFGATEMQTFLMQHIIPKLQLVLNEFIINPLQQNLELWNQVWEWHELIPPIHMAQLLDKHFFPKWMQVLVMWLNQSPDYAEISRWYTGWKSMLSEEVLQEPCIKEHLRRALEMMHRATDVASVPLNVPGVGIPTPVMTSTPPPPQPPPGLIGFQLAVPAQLEFKELVSQKCAELGILFAPMPGRRELGKQVYRVGKLYCYIDRNVIMLSDSSFSNWMPTSLSQMLEHARTGVL